jgi:hypothetical protein
MRKSYIGVVGVAGLALAGFAETAAPSVSCETIPTATDSAFVAFELDGSFQAGNLVLSVRQTARERTERRQVEVRGRRAGVEAACASRGSLRLTLGGAWGTDTLDVMLSGRGELRVVDSEGRILPLPSTARSEFMCVITNRARRYATECDT